MEIRAQGHKCIRVKIRFSFIMSFALLLSGFPAGCSQSYKIKTDSRGIRQLDTPAGMIEYLQQPAYGGQDLQSVDIWENKYGQGLKLATAHYEVFTTLLEPLILRAIPGFVESAYREYNNQLAEPIETTSRFTIYLFADRKQWEDFTETFAGEQAELFCKIKSGAYYLNGACVTYNIGIERTFTALGHEGWHQFNSRCFTFRLPSWLDEGVAMLFEAHKSERGTFYFEPAENTYRLDALKKTLAQNKMIPLRELIAINPGEVLATNESEWVMAFYSQSYALARFLREGGYEKRLANYRRLLLDGLKGDWPLNQTNMMIAVDRNIPRTVQWNRAVGQLLFKRYIGSDFIQIEKEYLSFCGQIISDTKPKNQDQSPN